MLASACAISGSRRVQSARTSWTPRARNASSTSWRESTSFLFTWQVTHHAAVNSTNTGFPAAVSAVSVCAEYGCHAPSPARSGAAPSRGNTATASAPAASRPLTPRAWTAVARQAREPCCDGYDHRSREQPYHRIESRLAAEDPREPYDRRVERERECLLEPHHPRARFRHVRKPRGEPGERDVGQRHPDPERGENAEGGGCVRGQREAERRTHKRCGARCGD